MDTKQESTKTKGAEIISATDMALQGLRDFRNTLENEQKHIFNAGVIGRLVAMLPPEVALNAIYKSVVSWEARNHVFNGDGVVNYYAVNEEAEERNG